MNSKNKRNKTVKLLNHNSSITLSNPRFVFKTFMECLEEGDSESAREVLAASLRHLNKSHLARRYHIPRRTTYNLLSRKVVPNLELVAKVCQAIYREYRTSAVTSHLTRPPLVKPNEISPPTA